MTRFGISELKQLKKQSIPTARCLKDKCYMNPKKTAKEHLLLPYRSKMSSSRKWKLYASTLSYCEMSGLKSEECSTYSSRCSWEHPCNTEKGNYCSLPATVLLIIDPAGKRWKESKRIFLAHLCDKSNPFNTYTSLNIKSREHKIGLFKKP